MTTILEAREDSPSEVSEPVQDEDAEPVDEYFELPLVVFEKVSYLHIDTYTKIGTNKYVKIISATDKNPIEQFFHFKQKGIQQVYIEKKDLSKYLLKAQEFLINKFSKNAKVMEKVEVGDYIFEFSKVALDFVGVSEQVYEVVNQQIHKISSEVVKDKKLGQLLKETASSQNYLSSHCIMVAYLSVNILKRINMTETSNYKKLIVASLFHDITMTDPRLARVKVNLDRLSGEQKTTVLNHMSMACEFIEKIVKVGEEDIFNIIKNSHERPDGLGFPKGLDGSKIKPLEAVFILSHEVVDYFFESDFNIPGVKHALENLPPAWREGVFSKPFQAILENLGENESN